MASLQHLDWKYVARVKRDAGIVIQYTIVFYRQMSDGWYDEIRYDSHDRRRGKTTEAPHFHLKIRSSFKGDTERAVAEIKGIINNYVNSVCEVLER